jgi:transcriptional antiterminator RfaH
MIPAGPAWYVVQTHPHAEANAASHLLRQGYSIYLLRYLRRRHARRVDAVAAPLSPRYLFVTIDRLAQRWRGIQSTVGVTRLVCNSEEPVVPPAPAVDEFMGRQNNASFIELDIGPRFSPGDKIRVVSGIFAASLGLFESMTDREWIAILFDILGRKTRVVLESDASAAA